MQLLSRLFACLCGTLMGAHALAADNAFIPPETRTGGRPVIGFQVEYAGWVNKMDDSRQRADRPKLCAMLGKPYINDTPPDEAAKARMIVVQTESASYAWMETNGLDMAERGNPCHLKLITQRRLTVARFDGRKTVVTTYNYGKRTKSQITRHGDFTYFGSHTIDVDKGKVTGKRRLGGIDCRDLRYLELGSKNEDYESACVTDPDPFPGRRQPRYHMDAAVVQPSIKIDSAVLDGPEGFQEKVRRPKQKQAETTDDEEEEPPITHGRRP
jgi:hypothetical protein